MASSSGIPISDHEQDTSARWDAFIGWAQCFFEWEGFDEAERNWKLIVAERLRAARDELVQGTEGWTVHLRIARNSPNRSLVNGWNYEHFLKWCLQDPYNSRLALMDLWNGEIPIVERIRNFRDNQEARAAVGGMSGHIASFLLMAEDPFHDPTYTYEPFKLAFELTDYPHPDPPPDDSGQIYQHGLDFLDRLMAEARKRGLNLRDRLYGMRAGGCRMEHGQTDSSPNVPECR